MNKQTIIIITIVALAVGTLGGYVLGSRTVSQKASDSSMMGGKENMGMDDMMAVMNGGLGGKKGDEFDKAFLRNMIVHHEGAVSMAQEAVKSAKHKEIVSLANAIITAQKTEISDMRSWLKDWYGIEYPSSVNSAEGAPAGSFHNLPVPAGVGAARKELARKLKIEENKIVIQTAFEKEWSDSCLGLGGAAESCAAVITPGYEVTMDAQGKTYVYRTNTEGTAVREAK